MCRMQISELERGRACAGQYFWMEHFLLRLMGPQGNCGPGNVITQGVSVWLVLGPGNICGCRAGGGGGPHGGLLLV
jgi:hypothetical protein